MNGITMERMVQRNNEIRKCIERARKCQRTDSNKANMCIEEAQALIEMQQLEIDSVQNNMKDSEFAQMKAIVAEHASLRVMLEKLKK